MKFSAKLLSSLFCAISLSVSAAEFTLGNPVSGCGNSGFGILSDYPDGKAGLFKLTRTTKPGTKPNYWVRWVNLCSLRIYDPDGNLFKYVEMGDQKQPVQTYEIQIPDGKPGVWRFTVSGGLTSDVWHVQFPENGTWGIAGGKLLQPRDGMPNPVYFYVPKFTEEMVLVGNKTKWSIGDVVLDGKRSKTSNMDRIHVTDVPKAGFLGAVFSDGHRIMKMEYPKYTGKNPTTVLVDGLPGLMCPSPEAAEKLRGGLVNVNGRELEGKTQAKAYQYIQSFQPEDFALPEAALKQKFWLGPLSLQILDKTSPFYGQFAAGSRKLNMMDYSDNYYRPGILAVFAAMKGEMPAAYQQKGMINRAILSGFDEIVNMTAEGLVRESNLRTTGRLDYGTMFSTFYAICRGYYFLKPLLSAEADAIYRAGVCEIADKEMGFICYQSNQWMHIIAGFNYLWLATGEPRYKRALDIQLNTFLDNTFHGKHGQHPDGYFLENGGPDGNYDNMSGYPLSVIYYTYRNAPGADPVLVEKMKQGIDRDMKFKSLFKMPHPDKEKWRNTMKMQYYSLPYANNHRIWGSLIGDGYPSIYLNSKEFDSAYSLVFSGTPAKGSLGDRDGEVGMIFKSLKQTAKQYPLLWQMPGKVCELPGHIAWRNTGKFYGVHFFKVYDEYPDGLFGPLLLWQQDVGLFLASIKNKNNGYLLAAAPNDVTWATVTGEVDGKFVTLDKSFKKQLIHLKKDQAFQITGREVQRNKFTGNEMSWDTDFSNPDIIKMKVQVKYPNLRKPTVSLPFFLDRGKNTGSIVKPGVFELKMPHGTVVCEYPAECAAEVIREMNSTATMALRIAMPENKPLEINCTVRK